MERVMITIPDLADEMHMKPATLYEFARREKDPLPLRTLDGMKRSSSIAVCDWLEWFSRNSKAFKDVRHG